MAFRKPEEVLKDLNDYQVKNSGSRVLIARITIALSDPTEKNLDDLEGMTLAGETERFRDATVKALRLLTIRTINGVKNIDPAKADVSEDVRKIMVLTVEMLQVLHLQKTRANRHGQERTSAPPPPQSPPPQEEGPSPSDHAQEEAEQPPRQPRSESFASRMRSQYKGANTGTRQSRRATRERSARPSWKLPDDSILGRMFRKDSDQPNGVPRKRDVPKTDRIPESSLLGRWLNRRRGPQS